MEYKRDTDTGALVTGPNGNAAERAPAHADGAIMARIVEGDSFGIGELYDRYGRAVYSLAYRVLSDAAEAEDVVQDVFAQAWRQAARYDPARAAVSGWLLMMTRARAIDRVRARRSRPGLRYAAEATSYDPADPALGPEAALLTADDIERVRGALEELNEAQRASIELAYYEGLTQVEIAEKLQEPLGTVKTRIRSGLLKLRSALVAKTEL